MDDLENKTEAVPKAPKPKKAKAKSKPKTKKTVKRKAAKPKKAKAKKAAKSKPKAKASGAIVRSERLDMRLSKTEKADILAKCKKTKRTVTSVVIEALAYGLPKVK